MAVTIGHASLDERGKISGGQAGDQNGKEVCTRQWYSKPWEVLLRPLDADLAEKSARACEAGCANNNIGYDQKSRNGLHAQAQAVGYDLSKIKTPCNTDCSAFMTVCAIAGGAVGLEYKGNAPTTSTMVNAFVKTGKYQQLIDSKYLTSDKYLRRGDILVKPGSHTVMVLGNGAGEPNAVITSKPKSALSYPCYGVDVAAWQTGLDYKKIKKAGCQFAILKIIRKDGNPDKMFEEHYNGFTSAGVPILAVYNYIYCTTVESAKIMAQKVIHILNGRKIPIVADVEDKTISGLGEKLIHIINGYQKVVEDAGLPFLCYTGLSFWNNQIKPYQDKLNCRNNWIARYYNGYVPMTMGQVPHPSYKPDVPNLIGWQYTSSLVIDGAPSRLDSNIMYSPVTQMSAITKGKTGVVTANALKIRTAPNTDSDVAGYLKKDEKVTIINTDASTGWYQIPQGWVSNKYISII